MNVNKKIAANMMAGLLGYIVFAGSVMLFYQDNPARMNLAERQKFNLKYIASIISGETTKSSVISYLGSPDITEAKQTDGVIYQMMFYRTHELKRDGITTKDECLPLLFLNGTFIASGDYAHSQYRSY